MKDKFLKICTKCGKPVYLSEAEFIGVDELNVNEKSDVYNHKVPGCNTTLYIPHDDDELPLILAI